MADRCLSTEEMSLTSTHVEMVLQRYVFPVQFVLGVLGNTINLSVLLSRAMRNRANDLLAAMALADLSVLLFMLPISMASFPVLANNYTFRLVYLRSKIHLSAIANWFSAAAIWLVLAVCIERLLIIKSPFRSQVYYKRLHQTALPVLLVFLTTACLTAYHHTAYDCFLYALCNRTQLYSQCLNAAAAEWPYNKTNPHSNPFRNYIRLSTIINALFVVIVPILLVAISNLALILLLRLRASHPLIKGSFRRNVNDIRLQNSQERRVAITVCAITSCFTITQGPSAVLFIYELFRADQLPSVSLHNASCITNSLVLTGKMLNVVLFCLTSANFRRRLCQTIKQYAFRCHCIKTDPRLETRAKQQQMTQRTSVTNTTSAFSARTNNRRSHSPVHNNDNEESRRMSELIKLPLIHENDQQNDVLDNKNTAGQQNTSTTV